MMVKQAKSIARQWVATEASTVPGFAGAFFHGSINWMADDAQLAPTSDLDVMLVVAEPPPVKLGKFLYNGVMIEISYLDWEALASAETILSTGHLVGSFQGGTIIADPTGRLRALEGEVALNYADPHWIRQRCINTEAKIRRNLDGIDPAAPLHHQITSWLFGTGVTTHLLLVAGLRNPTVRRRYVAVRDLLREIGEDATYTTLLQLLGCAEMDRTAVQAHLNRLIPAFDAAATVIRSPFFFAADLSEQARPVAIGGSQELIDRGDHREAIFWIVATYARCQDVFATDAPDLLATYTPHFEQLIAALGVYTYKDRVARRKVIYNTLPQLWQVAELFLKEGEIKN